MASRTRRPPSPLHNPTLTPRFTARAPGFTDADEKKATAISGDLRRSYPSGGLKVTGGEWKLLIVIVIVALGVRLFRLSQPNSVVYVFLRWSTGVIAEPKPLDLTRSTLGNSPRSISKLNSTLTYIRPSPNYLSHSLRLCGGLMENLTSRRSPSSCSFDSPVAFLVV